MVAWLSSCASSSERGLPCLHTTHSALNSGRPVFAADVAAPADAIDAPRPVDLPSDALIILPVRNFVLFPGVVMPVAAGSPVAIAAAQAGRAPGQAGRHPDAARSRSGRAFGWQTCTASAWSPISCAMSRRQTARTTDLPRASSASGSSEFVREQPFLAGARPAADRRADRAHGPEIEARFLHLQGQARRGAAASAAGAAGAAATRSPIAARPSR